MSQHEYAFSVRLMQSLNAKNVSLTVLSLYAKFNNGAKICE